MNITDVLLMARQTFDTKTPLKIVVEDGPNGAPLYLGIAVRGKPDAELGWYVAKAFYQDNGSPAGIIPASITPQSTSWDGRTGYVYA